MALRFAEQNVGNLNNCTFRISGNSVRRTKCRKSQQLHFRNSGTPLRRTIRRIYRKLHVQKFWDTRAQNKTSDISTHEFSGIMGLLCAEQNVGNLINVISRILGLLCAEQDVGNLNNKQTKQTQFQDSWSVRRTTSKI